MVPQGIEPGRIQVVIINLPEGVIPLYEKMSLEANSYLECMRCADGEQERDRWREKMVESQSKAAFLLRHHIEREVGPELITRIIDSPRIDFWTKKVALTVLLDAQAVEGGVSQYAH